MKNDNHILVLGAHGMLGQDIMNIFPKYFDRVTGIDIDELNITQEEQIRKKLPAYKPNIVLNSAAYTQVDLCETERETADLINGKAVYSLARVCKEQNVKLVHISTDYVFDGNKEGPYLEDDQTNPINEYGCSKLKGEQYIQATLENYLIVRTSWLFGKGGNNFVKTMIKLEREKEHLEIVDDQTGRPTFTRHLARAIAQVLTKEVTGILNIANEGICTWCEFAKMILMKLDKDPNKIKPVSTQHFLRPAKRPRNSVLSLDRLRQDCKVNMPVWEKALEEYLKE